MQVQNDMAYAWSAIKMSPFNTTASARRIFQVAPYLDPHNDIFNLPHVQRLHPAGRVHL